MDKVIDIKPIVSNVNGSLANKLDLSYNKSKRDTIPPTASANVDKGELRR